ncbi:MAG: hypothetical protein DRN04_16930 [Thermoprotei archaeon]|nr:MAG: hypothetical protein DRN04_16930 [Thermoprotei archaeon]
MEEKSKLDKEIKETLTKIILPKKITQAHLRKYIRKALANRSWHLLTKLERSLLWLTSKIVPTVKSPTLRKTIQQILLKIELATTRGKALYYGILILIKKLKRIEETVQNLTYTLYLGLSYLNNPPTYRIYG